MKLADASLSPLYQKRSIQLQDEEAVQRILADSGYTKKAIATGDKPEAGQIVGVRLNVNMKKVAVQTIHAGSTSDGYTRNKGLYDGLVRTYCQVVVLREAYFNVNQKKRQKIAVTEKATKEPMASVDGRWVKTDKPCFDGIEVSFNPKRVHLFVDALNRPIRYAEEVTIYGHRAYVRGVVVYYTKDNAPEKEGDAASAVVFTLPDTTDEDYAPGLLPLAAEQSTQASLFI